MHALGEAAAARTGAAGGDVVRLRSPARPRAARARELRRPVAWARASASTQSASHGLRGSNGPWRYVPIDAARPAAFEPALAVVAEPVDDTAERKRTCFELRTSGVILESRKRPAGPLAVEQDVADHPSLAGDRVQRQQPDPRQLDAVTVAIEAAEKLVTAADGENDAAAPPPPRARPSPSPRGRRRREPARDPGRRRCRAGRNRRRAAVADRNGATSSSWPRHAARRASTAMLPRSA